MRMNGQGPKHKERSPRTGRYVNHRYMSRGGLDQLLQLEHSGKLDPRVKVAAKE